MYQKSWDEYPYALSCYFIEGSAHCLSPPTHSGKWISCAVCLVCTLAFYVEHIASLRGSYQLFVFMVKELEDKKLNKQQLVHWLSESFIYPGGGGKHTSKRMVTSGLLFSPVIKDMIWSILWFMPGKSLLLFEILSSLKIWFYGTIFIFLSFIHMFSVS